MLRFNESFIEVLPGFRVVPESPVYPLTDHHADGHLEYFDDEGDLTRHRFILINSLCRPEDIRLFNMDEMNRLIVDGLTKMMVGDVRVITGIVWK